MHIIDLEGKRIEVTDLVLATLQADDYRHYKITHPEGEQFNIKQQSYWEDVYQKLLSLENEQTEFEEHD